MAWRCRSVPKISTRGFFFSPCAMWNYRRSWFSAALALPAAATKPLPLNPKVWRFFKGGGGVWGGSGCRARRCYHHCNPAWLRLSVSPLGCHGRGTPPSRGRDPLPRSQLSPHTTAGAPDPSPSRTATSKISPQSARLLLRVCPLKSSEVKQIDESDISMHTKKLFWYAAPFVL